MTKQSAESSGVQLWLAAWHNLHALDDRPLVSRGDIDQWLDLLPERAMDETLASWLGRTRPAVTAQVLPFWRKVKTFQPVTEFYRMAADSGSERYPLPETTLESADGRMWLSVRKSGDDLEITIQAVGMAIDELAGKSVGLATAKDAGSLVAVVDLNDLGEGTISAADTEAVRRALLHPVLGIVEFSDS